MGSTRKRAGGSEPGDPHLSPLLRLRSLSAPCYMLVPMAKKQTRRCVSLSRPNYEAAKQEAFRRGITVTALVEYALGAVGVTMTAHPQQPPELVRANAARRAARVGALQDGHTSSMNIPTAPMVAS
jgi:hypothetical protein